MKTAYIRLVILVILVILCSACNNNAADSGLPIYGYQTIDASVFDSTDILPDDSSVTTKLVPVYAATVSADTEPKDIKTPGERLQPIYAAPYSPPSTVTINNNPSEDVITSQEVSVTAPPSSVAPAPSTVPPSSVAPTPSTAPPSVVAPVPSTAPPSAVAPAPSTAPPSTVTPVPSTVPPSAVAPAPSTAPPSTVTPVPSTAPPSSVAPIPSTAPPPSPPSYSNEIVYITATGSKYHLAGCRHLSKSQIEISLEDAIAGYGPCSVCDPPQ